MCKRFLFNFKLISIFAFLTCKLCCTLILTQNTQMSSWNDINDVFYWFLKFKFVSLFFILGEFLKDTIATYTFVTIVIATLLRQYCYIYTLLFVRAMKHLCHSGKFQLQPSSCPCTPPGSRFRCFTLLVHILCINSHFDSQNPEKLFWKDFSAENWGRNSQGILTKIRP